MCEEVDGIHVRRISMRRGDLWRLPAVVLSWWCRPALRLLVGLPPEDQPLESEGTEGEQRGDWKISAEVYAMIGDALERDGDG